MGVPSDRIGFHRPLQESCHIMNDRHFGGLFFIYRHEERLLPQ